MISVKAYRDGFSLLQDAGNEPLRIQIESDGNRINFPVPDTGESFTVVCEARKKGEKTAVHRAYYLFLIGDPPLPRTPVLRFVKEYRALCAASLTL